MTVDERLAELLERATPEPPRIPTVADIERRLPSRPRRSGAPLVAAACVLLLVLGVVVLTHRSHERTAAPSSAPWRLTMLDGDYPPQYGPELFGDGAGIFDLERGPGTDYDAVERRSSRSGAVFARTQLKGLRIWGEPGLTASLVVVPVLGRLGRDGVSLLLLDRRRLAVRGQLPAVADQTGQDAIAAAQANTAYLAVGRRVTVFDLTRHTVTGHLSIPSEVNALDIYQGRLYIGTDRGQVFTTDGTALRTIIGSAGGGVDQLRITAGGMWLATVRRHVGELKFNGRVVARGKLGSYPSVEMSDGVAWITGSDFLACADPDTGTVRARHAQPNGVAIDPIIAASGHVLAGAYRTHVGSSSLVRVQPPPACGG